MKKAERILVDLKSAIVEIYEWPTFLETNWGTHYVAIYKIIYVFGWREATKLTNRL